MIPAEETLILATDELAGVRSWAERHGVWMEWIPETLELRVKLVQPETNALYFLRGRFPDYRALPPEWTFTDEGWQQTGRQCDSPKSVQMGTRASIFLQHKGAAVVCAPFNRLAFTEFGGPHGDWDGLANWLNAGTAQIHAETMGDMLQAMYLYFLVTRARMTNP